MARQDSLNIFLRGKVIGEKNIDHLLDYVGSENRWQWGRAAASGYARYIRDNLLSGRLLRTRSGKLKRSVKGKSAAGEPSRPRNAVGIVQAGSRTSGKRGIEYALAQEVGINRSVWVNWYMRQGKRVEGHWRKMNIPPARYMQTGMEHGDEYARAEVQALALQLKNEMKANLRGG